MATVPVDTPMYMVLSGNIPHILEAIVEYACETAAELCRLAMVSRNWRMVSERDHMWKSICQKRGCNFDFFGDTPDPEDISSPMYSRAKWKSLYVRYELIKYKMRKGDGVWKAPVKFQLTLDDDALGQVGCSELYMFVVVEVHYVAVYRKDTAERVSLLDVPRFGGIRAMAAFGKTLVTSAYADHGVRIWAAEKGKCRHEIYPRGADQRTPTRFLHRGCENRLILAENHWNQDGSKIEDVTLRSYDTMTGEVMQTSATMEGLGCINQDLRASGDYVLTVSNACHVTDTDCYALWHLPFLTCTIVIEVAPTGPRQRRRVLLDADSNSIVSHTFYDKPANAKDVDTVVVWDFNGAIKLRMQTTDGDRFHDVAISQRKLITLLSQYIHVCCLLTGSMQCSPDVRPGQELSLSPFLHKYIYDYTVKCAPGSRALAAYLNRVVGADKMKQCQSSTYYFSHIDIVVQEPDSRCEMGCQLQLHTIDFNVPYP